MVREGIPTIADYSHWNEEAAAVWWAENKYDMSNERELDVDDDMDFDRYEDDDEDIDIGTCQGCGAYGEVGKAHYRYDNVEGRHMECGTYM